MSGYSDTLHFDSVVILESLPPGDQKTGRRLYDQVLEPIERQDPAIRVSYNTVSSRTVFFKALKAIEEQMIDKGRAPIVHIEAHGTKEGIRLASDELVLWEELREALTRMNEKCGLNLLLVMAMCRGWHLADLLTPLQRTPVWGLIGPMEDVWDTDLFAAMSAFYVELFRSFKLTDAIASANAATPTNAPSYEMLSAEILYCRVFEHYVATSCAPEQLEAREREIVAERLRLSDDYLVTTAMVVREDTRGLLRDYPRFFEYYRRRFLMLDLFPNYNKRFKLTYDDCGR